MIPYIEDAPETDDPMPPEKLVAQVMLNIRGDAYLVVMPLIADLIGGLDKQTADEVADALNRTMFESIKYFGVAR